MQPSSKLFHSSISYHFNSARSCSLQPLVCQMYHDQTISYLYLDGSLLLDRRLTSTVFSQHLGLGIIVLSYRNPCRQGHTILEESLPIEDVLLEGR